MNTADATQRFFRPHDVTRVRRNQHRIQFQRIAVIGRNFLFIAALAIGAVWMYRHTQSDARFAVRHIEVAGAVHTPRRAVDEITRRYVGLNLFQIDIARVQRDLGSLPWIQRISIEKKIPDTLRINVVERTPVAIVRDAEGWLQYVDGSGVVLTELSPSIGDDDLPMITNAAGDELTRTVQFVRDVKRADAALYSRMAEVRPVAPRGFAVFDRELATTIYVDSDDAAAKWRSLYAVVQGEKLGAGAVEYADLRFADRIVLKPLHPTLTTSAAGLRPAVTADITN
jgi:cell division protein FtsQ